jgi:PAS domain S-box-containing protein
MPSEVTASESMPREVQDKNFTSASGLASRLPTRSALAAVLVSALIFLAIVPFATRQLSEVPAFIPVYEAALVICDLITAILLFGQFNDSRSRATFVLANGYLFTAFVAFAHALTFPGVFSLTGLMGAGTQSTSWLYTAWHTGLPLFVVFYAVVKDKGRSQKGDSSVAIMPRRRDWMSVIVGAFATLALACGVTFAAMANYTFLPDLIVNNHFTPAMKSVIACIWLLSVLALALLWRRRPRTTLDVWLMVVMCAWIFDIGLSGLFDAARFDLGWYAGRIYGLAAAGSLLVVLLLQSGERFGTRSRTLLMAGMLVLIAAMGLQSFLSHRGLLASNSWVEHTQQVLAKTGELSASLAQAESAERGYLVSSGEPFLQSYRSAATTIPTKHDQLQQLTVDNPAQQIRIAELKTLIEQRLARMQLMIEIRQSGGTLDTGDLQVGAGIMVKIDQAISDINAEEQKLYGIRIAAVKQGASRAIAWAGGLTAFSILIIAWLGAAVMRESRGREAGEIALRELNNQLELRIEARAGEVLRANELLLRSNEMMNAIVDSSPLAIVSLDREQKIVIWNRGACELLGYTPQEAIGLDFAAVATDKSGELLERVRELVASDVVQSKKVSHHDRDGKPIQIQLFVAPLRELDGPLRGSVILMEDLTERSAVESQLRHAHKMESVGQLTGGLAHDFNNLLAVIIGNLDYVGETLAVGSEAHGYLDRAQAAALRGAELNRQLLAFARRQPLQAEAVDINALAVEMIKLQSRTLGESIHIKTDFAPDVAPVMADASQIESALLNLCVNARDAMPKGGTLTIATANHRLDEDYVSLYPDARVGDYVMLSVSDTGSGMTREVVARAFEPFFTTKGVGKGSGLGLSMVYGFAKQSGGHANIYSELGVGTVIRIYLPQARGAGTAVAAEPVTATLAADTNHVILAVDDNADVRRVAVKQLRGFGYQVIEAVDGPDALKMLKSSRPIDLLFTDVVMPGGVSGVDLARTARESQPGLRVLFTSGFPDMASNTDIGAMGDLIISKPYLRAELGAMVRKVLDRQPGGIA